jgi:hypothetical protein
MDSRAAFLSIIILMRTLSLQDVLGETTPLTTTAVTIIKAMMSAAKSNWYALFCLT